MIERTLSLIKPDAISRNISGKIIALIEAEGLRIIAQKRLLLAPKQARDFYSVHAQRPFYGELCDYMASGPIVAQLLEADNAIARYRQLMGATDPAKAEAGTLRADFGQSIQFNAVHGSDSTATATNEIAFFFNQCEIYS